MNAGDLQDLGVVDELDGSLHVPVRVVQDVNGRTIERKVRGRVDVGVDSSGRTAQ